MGIDFREVCYCCMTWWEAKKGPAAQKVVCQLVAVISHPRRIPVQKNVSVFPLFSLCSQRNTKEGAEKLLHKGSVFFLKSSGLDKNNLETFFQRCSDSSSTSFPV